LGLLLLGPWKSVIARRGLARRRPGTWVSVVLGVLVVMSVVAGVGQSTGLLMTWGLGLSAMQVHVGAALLAVPFALAHLVARPVGPRRTDLSRRAALRSGALAVGSVAAYGAVAGLTWVARLPARDARFTGSLAAGSFEPGAMPVTQWLFDSDPALDPTAWRLSIRADGAEVTVLSLQELEAMREPVRAALDCTNGWFAEQDWEGVRVDRLLAAAGASMVDVRSIAVTSVTGYGRRFPVADTGRLWLATGAGGTVLSSGHGAPARIVVPGRRGFWWVKWVTAIEAGATPWWWQPPFPVR
jgi:DMSO/TMAO reductase YedYZ molybdopterin-dependent catalytic subunit